MTKRTESLFELILEINRIIFLSNKSAVLLITQGILLTEQHVCLIVIATFRAGIRDSNK